MSTDVRAEPTAPPAAARRARPGELWSRWTARIRPSWLTDDVLRGVRWGLIGTWVFAFTWKCVRTGIPFDREGLLLWVAAGAAAACVGKRSVLAVLVDFLPFALVLVAYDYLRGLSYQLGMPTWWHPQADLDRILGFGHSPTVWLQEHLKHAQVDVQWYDLMTCVCYYSFFFLPYVMAGVMWWRSRVDFYRWSLRFVSLSFFAFAFFALIPSAPPWAAARCTAADIANHPSYPLCMRYPSRPVTGNLLGAYTSHVSGSNPYVERIAGNSFFELHLGVAHTLWTKGFNIGDPVAAVPSLHCGGIVLFSMFMWRRVNRWWRPFLAAYPLIMTFSLVYAGEHYVVDCIAGALSAVLIHLLANRIERWRKARRATDTLGGTHPESQESPCPPQSPPETWPPATTPSSTSASGAASSTPPARSTADPAPPGTTARSAPS